MHRNTVIRFQIITIDIRSILMKSNDNSLTVFEKMQIIRKYLTEHNYYIIAMKLATSRLQEDESIIF